MNRRIYAIPIRRSALTLAGAAAVLASLAACGSASIGSSNLDVDKVETALTAKMNEQVPAGTASTVTCPDKVELHAGGTFQCQASIGDQKFSFKVTQKDDTGNVSFIQDSAILKTATIDAALDQKLAAEAGGTWKTTCADANPVVIVAAPKSTFVCTAQGTGNEVEGDSVTVTVNNVEGDVSWKLT